MRIPRTLAALSLAAAVAFPALAGSAGAVDTTELTVVNGYSFDAENLMEQTVCLDDVLVQSGAAVINPTITTTPGEHVLKVWTHQDADCTDETIDWTETPVTLLDVAAQTLAIGWENWDTQEPDHVTWIFEDDQDCLPAGQSKIVFRNISSYDPLVADLGSDEMGQTDISGATALLSGVAVGDEASADVDSGTYPADPSQRMFGWEPGFSVPFVGSDVQLAIPDGTVAYVYAHSGNDGAVGLASTVREVGVCDAPVTTTTAPTSTTTTPETAGTAATPARPVAATPTYTG